MTRKELASKVFLYVRKDLALPGIKDVDIWKAIAETDDRSLLKEYEQKEYEQNQSISAKLKKECINNDT